MEYKTRLSNHANIDLERIVEYYFEINKKTVGKYYSGILNKIKKLKSYPVMGRIVPECEDLFYDKYRELIFEDYRIIYRIENDTIMILRIFNGKMDIDFNYIDS